MEKNPLRLRSANVPIKAIVRWERFVTALIKLDILCFKFAIVFYSLDVVSVIWGGLVHTLPKKAFYTLCRLLL